MKSLVKIPPISSFEQYVSAVMKIPMVEPEEEIELAKKVRDQNDLEAAHRLVLAYLKLVVRIAHDNKDYGLPVPDLVQEGNVGLMKAVKKFDPDRGIRLYSFAIHWIKAEIYEFIIKNWRIVKIATTKPQRKLFFNLRSMMNDLNHLTPERAEQISKEINVPLRDVYSMESRLFNGEVALDPLVEEGEDYKNPIYSLADEDSDPLIAIEQADEESNHQELLKKALDSLDERSRKIIEARWLTEQPQTLKELSQQYSVTPERIRQIEAKALAKMKKVRS